jgi:adenylate cyclase
MNLLMQSNDDFAYVIADDHQENHQIVAAAPADLAGQYITDLVPVSVSKRAIHFGKPPRATSLQARIAETYLLRDIEFPAGKIRAHKGERIIEAAIDIPNSNQLDLVSGTFRVGITLRHLETQIFDAIKKTLIVGIAASFGKLQKTLDSFERFVPGKFLQVIAPRDIENITVGEYAKHTMTILFSDIRGYTSLSETQTPEEMFIFLNEYLACMGKAIDQEGGDCKILVTDAILKALKNPQNFNLDLVDESVKVKGKELAIGLYRLNVG